MARTNSSNDSWTINSTDDGGAGGSETYDSTNRIYLNSYQRALEPDNYGEVIRAYSRHPRSKQAMAWYKAYKNDVVVTYDHTTDTWTSEDHYLEVGDRVVFRSTSALPTGISTGYSDGYDSVSGTAYVVVSKTDDTFQVSATRGGSVVNASSNGTGTLYFTMLPKVKAWLNWHYLPNDSYDGLSPHDHISIESPDGDGLLRSRLEVVTTAQDITEVNTSNANFTVKNGYNGVADTDGSTKYFAVFTSTGVIDQKQIYYGDTGVFGEADATTKQNRIAQSFTAGNQRYVGVRFYKLADTGTFTGTVTVELFANNGSFVPTGSALGTKTFSNASWLALSTGENTATFAAEVTGLTVGGSYSVVFRTSTADTSNHPNIGMKNSASYTGGTAKIYNTTDGWSNLSADLYFKMIMPSSGVTRGKDLRWYFGGTSAVEQNETDGTDFFMSSYDNNGNFLRRNITGSRKYGTFEIRGTECGFFIQKTPVTVGGSPVTDTTLLSDTNAVGTRTITASTLAVGDIITFKIRGRYTGDASPGNVTYKVQYGSTTIVSCTAHTPTASRTNGQIFVDCGFTITATGASGTANGWITGRSGSTLVDTGNGASPDVTIDTTVDTALNFVVTTDDDISVTVTSCIISKAS